MSETDQRDSDEFGAMNPHLDNYDAARRLGRRSLVLLLIPILLSAIGTAVIVASLTLYPFYFEPRVTPLAIVGSGSVGLGLAIPGLMLIGKFATTERFVRRLAIRALAIQALAIAIGSTWVSIRVPMPDGWVYTLTTASVLLGLLGGILPLVLQYLGGPSERAISVNTVANDEIDSGATEPTNQFRPRHADEDGHATHTDQDDEARPTAREDRHPPTEVDDRQESSGTLRPLLKS